MVILFGPAGAGKSMQGALLTERHGWHWLSTGELFRQSDDPAVIATLKAGELISDQQTFQTLEAALQSHGDNSSIVLDGFPRTEAQAKWLVDQKLPVEAVVVLDVPTEEIVERLSKRGRIEDTPEAIRRRMEIYHSTLDTILAVLIDAKLPIAHVNGVGDVEDVNQRIVDELESRQIKQGR